MYNISREPVTQLDVSASLLCCPQHNKLYTMFIYEHVHICTYIQGHNQYNKKYVYKTQSNMKNKSGRISQQIPKDSASLLAGKRI